MVANWQWKVGDVVKSIGVNRPITIEKIFVTTCRCTWFDADDVLRGGVFRLASLFRPMELN